MALKPNIMEEFTQSRRAGMGSFGAGIMSSSALASANNSSRLSPQLNHKSVALDDPYG